MTISEIYNLHYTSYRETIGCSSKYEWAADKVFDLVTYDDELDRLFVEKIIEVLKAILNRTTYEYIEKQTNYVTYILVCQILDRFQWIDWGTSIRGAWFGPYRICKNGPRPILEDYEIHEHTNDGCKTHEYPEVPCTTENIKALIEFIEEEE